MANANNSVITGKFRGALEKNSYFASGRTKL